MTWIGSVSNDLCLGHCSAGPHLFAEVEDVSVLHVVMRHRAEMHLHKNETLSGRVSALPICMQIKCQGHHMAKEKMIYMDFYWPVWKGGGGNSSSCSSSLTSIKNNCLAPWELWQVYCHQSYEERCMYQAFQWLHTQLGLLWTRLHIS